MLDSCLNMQHILENYNEFFQNCIRTCRVLGLIHHQDIKVDKLPTEVTCFEMTEVKINCLVQMYLSYPKFFLRMVLNYWMLLSLHHFIKQRAIAGLGHQYFNCVRICELFFNIKFFFLLLLSFVYIYFYYSSAFLSGLTPCNQ